MLTADASALGEWSRYSKQYVKKHYEVSPRVISTHCVSPLTIITTPFYRICGRVLFLYCLYLAVQLRFIHVSFFTASGTSTSSTAGFIEVPDLHTMSWLHAVATSEKLGFRLVLVEGQPDGVVVDQNPRAHDKAAKGSTIDVKLEILTPKIGLQARITT